MSGTSAGVVWGARHAMGGFRLIVKPGVRLFVILPLLINTILFILALSGLGATLDYAVDRYLADWPEWIQWLLWCVFGLLAALIVFFTFALIANVVASPFNGLLAEAVERYLNGQLESAAFSWKKFADDALRSIRAELRKLLYFAVRAIPLVIISIIPVINVDRLRCLDVEPRISGLPAWEPRPSVPSGRRGTPFKAPPRIGIWRMHDRIDLDSTGQFSRYARRRRGCDAYVLRTFRRRRRRVSLN